MTLPDLALMGFVIGFTGALAPGPTLIATIQSTVHIGWTGGPRVTLGHIIAELGIVVLIAVGVSTLPESVHPLIAWTGGIALIIFGIITLIGSGKSMDSESGSNIYKTSPVIAGLLTSVSNPFFWIWWFSVGSALLFSSLSMGIAGLCAFITGHWLADLSWFTLVSVSIHKSRAVMSNRVYQRILILCGVLLIFFGIWFLIQV
jgi:threonine/homoserine/homoserine lactone efflux protein